MDETWSSKMFSAVSMLAKNFFVLLGRLAAVVTGVSIQARGVVFILAIVCFSLPVREPADLLLKYI